MAKEKPVAEATATPNPVPAGENYTLEGCGYDMRPVEVHTDGQFTYAVGVVSAGGNCLDGNYFPAPDDPGTYTLELLQQKEHGKKKDVKATVELVVE